MRDKRVPSGPGWRVPAVSRIGSPLKREAVAEFFGASDPGEQSVTVSLL